MSEDSSAPYSAEKSYITNCSINRCFKCGWKGLGLGKWWRRRERLGPRLIPQVSFDSSVPSRQSGAPSQSELLATQPPSWHVNPLHAGAAETTSKPWLEQFQFCFKKCKKQSNCRQKGIEIISVHWCCKQETLDFSRIVSVTLSSKWHKQYWRIPRNSPPVICN